MVNLRINWKKITYLESELHYLRITNTRKEDIIFVFLEDSIRKNPENPFEFFIHIKDYEEIFKPDILRKTMEGTNRQGLTEMINKHVGNYFIKITRLAITEMRRELVILEEIMKELHENSQLRMELFRLNKRWMVLKKYDKYLKNYNVIVN